MKARITAKDGGPMDSELSFGHRRIRKATRLALGACLLVLLAPPGPALAADVVVAGGVLSFSNANGELNDVTVSVAGGDLHRRRPVSYTHLTLPTILLV